MKRLLLTTTALITLVAVTADAAPKSAKAKKAPAKAEVTSHVHDHGMKSHSSFKVDLHGRQEFDLAVRSVKKNYMFGDGEVRQSNGYLTRSQKNFGFDSNTKLALEVSSVAENGMKYGVNVGLTPNASQQNRNFSSMDKTFLFMEGGFGRIEAGSNFSVATLMEISAASVAAGTGGASNGYWSQYANVVNPGVAVGGETGDDKTNKFILQGRNYLYRDALQSTAQESSRKISFMSPRFSGLQLGVSYTPDQDNGGSTGMRVSPVTSTPYLKNVYNVALNYDHKVGGMDFSGTVLYNAGKNTNPNSGNYSYDLSEWAVGGKVAKGPLSVAASYDDAGKSGQDRNKTVSLKNNFWTVGLGYEMNKLTTSLTYMSAQKGHKQGATATVDDIYKSKAWSIGVDYMLASGLKTYAEFTSYSLKSTRLQVQSTATHPSNNGSVFLAGAVVKF